MAVKRVDTAEEFEREYSRVRNLLINALQRQLSGGDEAELLRGIADRRYILWTSENSACVTKIINLDGAELCCLYLVAGETNSAIDEILNDGQDEISSWAKSIGCKGLFGVGRQGWERVLAPHGFKVQSVNYFKEL